MLGFFDSFIIFKQVLETVETLRFHSFTHALLHACFWASALVPVHLSDLIVSADFGEYLCAGRCGSPAWRFCCCCSGPLACCWWRASTRVSPSTWTGRSPGASRRSAARSSASSASAARRTRTTTRRPVRCRRRSCCSTTARGSCWRSARVSPSPRASARAARRIITLKRCRGSTCCRPAHTPVSTAEDPQVTAQSKYRYLSER